MSKSESLIFVEDCKRLRYLKFDGLKFLNNHFEIKNLQTVIFFFFEHLFICKLFKLLYYNFMT